MTDPRLRLDIDGAVARLTIARPEKRNALDAAMVEALRAHCWTIERSPARVVLLTGEGDHSFCAGGDIAAWSGLSPDQFTRTWLRDGHDAFDALARLTQPVVALLNGDAFGGGLELAACADARIAEAHARFALPESGLGIIPGWSGTQRTVRRFGVQVVRRMALFGEVLTAEAALAAGIADAVVPRGEGVAAANRLIERLTGRAPRATEFVKLLLNAAEGEETERVLETLAGALAAGSAELAEGLAAYRERRVPSFAQPAGEEA
ncbi:MAG: enoyl-CoA hydratase/isomerase family protein [Amaricoccus sp.]|uniref:enoyl-CoA hydratase/isomerase family protein n=1 Tax=Amaricoccus sp. TaxID=1872485 RepID=UPI0039E456D4